jgi:hypothetical protein
MIGNLGPRAKGFGQKISLHQHLIESVAILAQDFAAASLWLGFVLALPVFCRPVSLGGQRNSCQRAQGGLLVIRLVALARTPSMTDPGKIFGINKLSGKHIDEHVIFKRPSRNGFTVEQHHRDAMPHFDVDVWAGKHINIEGRATSKPSRFTTNEPIAPP